MAEAVVDGALIPRFFCHKCSVEIESLLPDYTCPRCACGFIEELESRVNDNRSGLNLSGDDGIRPDSPTFSHDRHRQILERMASSGPYDGVNWQGIQSNVQRGTRPTSTQSPQGNRFNSNFGLRRENVVPMIESLLQDLLFQRYPMQAPEPSVINLRLFMGNPGDYVWGRDGLDAIVTQLLNQMDGSGPPPLPKKQIDEIPTTTVTQEQVDCKLQCSVCWEDFVLDEKVRLLPCQHVYHELCIIPWLELHGTCPICRQNLGDQNSTDTNQDTVGSSLAALLRAANESISSRPESTSFTPSDSSDD